MSIRIYVVSSLISSNSSEVYFLILGGATGYTYAEVCCVTGFPASYVGYGCINNP